MVETLVIDKRFCGPPGSANGGYACGVAAELLDPGDRAVEATLRVPPPLDRRMTGSIASDGRAEVTDGETLVAEARIVDRLQLELPDPPSLEQAEKAGRECPWAREHPYGTCFACGPGREYPDGLHLLTGPVGERELIADVWTPDPIDANASGQIDPLVLWAALDCPSGNAALYFQPFGEPSMLGRLTAKLIEPVMAGVDYIVVGWPVDWEGRKHRGGSAIFRAADGKVVGAALGVWIELKPE